MRIKAVGTSIQVATGGRPLDGNDPVVVLVHGAGMDRSVWYQQSRFLAHNGFRAIALDLPGHGGTPGPPFETIESMADWLATFIAELGGSVHLIGHSMGALVAIDTAARYRNITRSVVVFGAGAAMPVHPDLQQLAGNDDDIADELVASWSFGVDQHIGHNPNPGSWMIGGAVSLLRRANDGVLATGLAACNAYLDGPVRMAEITCAVTVVAGTDDRMTPLRAAKALVDASESAKMITVEGAGHMAMVEKPDVSRTAILDHLTDAENSLTSGPASR